MGKAKSPLPPLDCDLELGYCVDPTSGFTWQVTPTGGEMDLSTAKEHCQALDLEGGGWRLPTIGELRTLVRGCPATADGGSCNVEEGKCLSYSCKNYSCRKCPMWGGPADGCYWPDEMEGECLWYWSSTLEGNSNDDAWFILFANGEVSHYHDLQYDEYVRCVR